MIVRTTNVKTTIVKAAIAKITADKITIDKTLKAASRCAVVLLVVAAVVMTGCTVYSHHDERDSSGKAKDVDIRTPFGSLSVREGAMEAKDTGLSDYPGAQLKKSKNHDGDSSANVNISSSLFGVKVVALNYETKDSPEKVADFYRKELAKYGKVLDCQGGFTLNLHPYEKNITNHEVTCEGDRKGGEYRQELKVGTESNQRVVAIKPVADGAEFVLVYVRTRNEKDTL